MTKEEKTQVRATIFQHLAGIVLAPTLTVLEEKGVLRLLQAGSKEIPLDAIARATNANAGYLRVAFRLLLSQGWLRQRQRNPEEGSFYSLTPDGRVAVGFAPLYRDVTSFIPAAMGLEDFLFGTPDEKFLSSFGSLVAQAKNWWGIHASSDPTVERVQSQILSHLKGVLIGPVMVALARKGILSRFEQEDSLLHDSRLTGHKDTLGYVFDLLATQGWTVREHGSYRMTPEGLYAASIAAAYGVTVSYLPLLKDLSSLLFEDPRVSGFGKAGSEYAVNREINVWASGAAHKNYFKRTDEVIRDIFNRPLHCQPRGICDMGCGDGLLLEQLYNAAKSQTIRGQVLETYPLILIGADISETARKSCSQRLARAGIPSFHVIPGDISRPDKLAMDLQELSLNAPDLLHVRSFLEHNRHYIPPAHYLPGTRSGKSTGVFVCAGEEIPPDVLEENLVEHLRSWIPYVSKFGLLVFELHTLPADVAAANLDKTPVVAYDATHGYSDQYPVELDVFLECARVAGLVASEKYQARFPSADLTTVSLNFFTVPSEPGVAVLSKR